ncbi:MAG: hypothetical protein GY708_18760 [Actinomycetia bacterium]|nr:hypothetical protein [Actinomycetes bacterium]
MTDRCEATTKTGGRCTRRANHDDGLCPQHRRIAKGLPGIKLNMAAEERQRRALHMAIGGATYDQTARALSYNDRSAARQATLTALAKIAPADDANEWRNLQVARYERMIYVSLPDAIGEEDRPVDLHAQDRVRRNMEAQARLLGLNAPTQTITTGNETGSLVRPELTLAEKRRIVEAELARRRPKVLAQIEAGRAYEAGAT